MVNRKWNEQYLEHKYYVPFLDLAVVYYIDTQLDYKNAPEHRGTAVTKDIFKIWSVEPEVIWKQVLENMGKESLFLMLVVTEEENSLMTFEDAFQKNQGALALLQKSILDEAKKKGAMALFSDKYGSVVRVVTIGDSVELCAGTHVINSKDINKIAIASVENKGSDTFRVIAATDTNIEEILGEEVSKYNEQMLKLLDKAKKIVLAAKELNIDLKFNFKIANDAPTSYKDIIINKNELESLKDSIKELEKEFIIKKNEKSISDLTSFLSIKEEINGITTIISITNDYDISTLKQIVSALSNQLDNSFILLANQNKDDSVNFIAKSTSNRVDCGMIIKELSTSCKGNGGGSKVFAQGGGTDGTNIAALLINIKEKIKKL